MSPCFGCKRRDELQQKRLQLPGPALIPSRIQMDVWHQFWLPPCWWHKGVCAHLPPLQNPDSHAEKVQRSSPLPVCLTALVPNEALQGMTHCTLQDWVLPLSWESICYGSEKPQVVVHLERTGRLHARAHKFNGSSLKAESHVLQLPTFMSRVSMEQWNRLLIRLIYIKV